MSISALFGGLFLYLGLSIRTARMPGWPIRAIFCNFGKINPSLSVESTFKQGYKNDIFPLPEKGSQGLKTKHLPK